MLRQCIEMSKGGVDDGYAAVELDDLNEQWQDAPVFLRIVIDRRDPFVRETAANQDPFHRFRRLLLFELVPQAKPTSHLPDDCDDRGVGDTFLVIGSRYRADRDANEFVERTSIVTLGQSCKRAGPY